MLKQFPLPSLSPTPVIGQNLAKAVEAREVRSEAELRAAIQEIAAETGIIGAAGLTFKSRALILIAAPFHISDTVTIPSSCSGIELASNGYTPISFPSGQSPCFLVQADFVKFTGITLRVQTGETPPAVFCDLDGADYFRATGCYVGGTTAGFRSPAGAVRSYNLYFSQVAGRGALDLATSQSSFVGCQFGDVTLSDPDGLGSDRNLFSSCEIDDITIASNGTANVFTGCYVDKNPDDSASPGGNVFVANSGGAGAGSWTGTGSVFANNA